MQRYRTGRSAVSRVVLLTVGVLVFAVGLGLLLYTLLGGGATPAPVSKALRLTVPDMKRVENMPV